MTKKKLKSRYFANEIMQKYIQKLKKKNFNNKMVLTLLFNDT